MGYGRPRRRKPWLLDFDEPSTIRTISRDREDQAADRSPRYDRGAPARTVDHGRISREAIDAEGWFHTGDLAEIVADGHISIVGRKKELIINSGGKNMSPVNIETAIKAAQPLVGQIMAIGDNRPYNVVLIVLDPDAAAAFATRHGLPDGSPAALAEDATVQAVIEEAVVAGNARLSRIEQ